MGTLTPHQISMLSIVTLGVFVVGTIILLILEWINHKSTEKYKKFQSKLYFYSVERSAQPAKIFSKKTTT